MHRRFSTAVGLTPKQFARVIRFQRTLEALGNGMRPAEAACEFGYCDQPHMTNEFTRFTGSSPDRFFRQRADTPLMSCFNSSMSRFYNTLYVN